MVWVKFVWVRMVWVKFEKKKKKSTSFLLLLSFRSIHPHVRCCDFDNVDGGGGEYKAQTHPTQKSGEGNSDY